MTRAYTTIDRCRVCHGTNLVEVLNLGDQYVSDFVAAHNVYNGVRCPIEILLCRDCTLVQQKHTAPQELLYSRHYWYRSGVTETMREALNDVVREANKQVQFVPGDVVLDIGSNDGTLLRRWKHWADVVTVGVEPARNLVEEGSKDIDVFINDFWSWDAYVRAAPSVRLGLGTHVIPKPKVVTALGMFYDLDDPNAFIRDVARVLHPDGVFIAQLMCLKQTLEKGDVGNFCHEHLEFYSLKSLRRLYANNGLAIYRVEENNVNGGSYRIYARKSNFVEMDSSSMSYFYAEEGIDRIDVYNDFRQRIENERDKCVDFIRREVGCHKNVYVYGASTKGNVILQYYGLDGTMIEGAADRSPEKWGLYTAGTGIKIVSEEEARKCADYFLVLPYAFRTEFLEREKEWRQAGGRMIFPLPQFEVV